MPFRDTHRIAGEAIQLTERHGCSSLSDLSTDDLKGIHPMFDSDVADVWDYGRSTNLRDTGGGTSKRSILEQISKLRVALDSEEAGKELS